MVTWRTTPTPGPWMVERGNVGATHPLFVVAPGKDGLHPWCDDDAHLIAAARELYEALYGFQTSQVDNCWCPHPGRFGHSQQCVQARFAIAKARGENRP